MRKKSRPCSSFLGFLALTGLASSLGGPAFPQFAAFSAASIEPSSGVTVEKPGSLQVPVAIRIRRGYHINSDRPNDPYLIPTVLSWNNTPFRVESIVYPRADEVRYDFSDKPLSVYSSRIEIVTTFRVESVPEGLRELKGDFRFQACNDKACLPPKTIAVSVPVRR